MYSYRLAIILLIGLVSNLQLLGQSSSMTSNSNAPSVAISVNKARILSRCFDNPMKLVASNYGSDDISLRGPNGIAIRKTGDYEYNISVQGAARDGQKCKIEVVQQKTGNVLSSFEYKIAACPTPVAKLTNGKTDGVVPAAEMRIQRGIMAPIENYDIDMRCKVTSFQVYYVRQGGDPIVLTNKGPLFGNQLRTYIQSVEPGDILQFTDVMARCPGDIVSKKLNSLAFVIR